MQILRAFIVLVLYIIFYFMIVSKTESKTENKTSRKYNACKKYNRHNHRKHNINRKKHKGDL